MRTHLIAGFTQTTTSWDGVVAALPSNARSQVAAIAVPERSTWAETVDELAATAGPGVWCGYSMGGRLALHVALAHPHVVRHLVLVSTTAGLRSATERSERVAADELLAQRALEVGAAAFLDEWMAQPMFAGVPADAPGVADRRTIPASRLAHDLRVLGTGAMPPAWDRLSQLSVPVTVVTGDRDTKFTVIGDDLERAIPHVRRVRVDCGHVIPLERPQRMAEVLHETHSAAARNNDVTS